MSRTDAAIAVLFALSGLWFGYFYAPPAAEYVVSLLRRALGIGKVQSNLGDFGCGMIVSLVAVVPAVLLFRTLTDRGHRSTAIGIAVVVSVASVLVFLVVAITRLSNARTEAMRARERGNRRRDLAAGTPRVAVRHEPPNGDATFAYQDGDHVEWPSQSSHFQARPDGTVLDVHLAADVVFKLPTLYYFESIDREFGSGLLAKTYLFIDEHLSLTLFGLPKYPIRRPLPEEHPSLTNETLRRFPRLQDMSKRPEYRHWIALTKLTDLRLRAMFGTSIPESALVTLRDSDGVGWEAVVQRRIDGPRLVDIIRSDGTIVAEFSDRAKQIAEQLRIFASEQNVDLSLTNFVFSPETGMVFYIESKPPFFRTRRRNEIYRGVLQSFIHQHAPT